MWVVVVKGGGGQNNRRRPSACLARDKTWSLACCFDLSPFTATSHLTPHFHPRYKILQTHAFIPSGCLVIQGLHEGGLMVFSTVYKCC